MERCFEESLLSVPVDQSLQYKSSNEEFISLVASCFLKQFLSENIHCLDLKWTRVAQRSLKSQI